MWVHVAYSNRAGNKSNGNLLKWHFNQEHLCRTSSNVCSPEYEMTKGQIVGAKMVILWRKLHLWQSNNPLTVSLVPPASSSRAEPTHPGTLPPGAVSTGALHILLHDMPEKIPAAFSREMSTLKTTFYIAHKMNGPWVESFVCPWNLIREIHFRVSEYRLATWTSVLYATCWSKFVILS